MKIDIHIKPPMLQKVNILIAKLTFNYNKRDRIDFSIIQQIALKFARKQFSLLGKDKSKAYKISIEYYEAEALERKLRFKANFEWEMHQLADDDYHLLIEFCGFLNQKIA